MKYILYLFVIHGSSLAIDSHEFESQEACEAAKEVVLEEAKSVTHTETGYHKRTAFCVAKG